MFTITFMVTTAVLLMVVAVLTVKLNELNKARKIALNTRIDNSKLEDELKEYIKDLSLIKKELEDEREKNRKILSQKKSSETRLGQITEHVLPFLKNCSHDPKSLRFLGSPVDLIAFDFDLGSITFIEVKSGNSKASKRQKIIKNIIKTGRVFYEEIRVNQKGITSKKAVNKDK